MDFTVSTVLSLYNHILIQYSIFLILCYFRMWKHNLKVNNDNAFIKNIWPHYGNAGGVLGLITPRYASPY